MQDESSPDKPRLDPAVPELQPGEDYYYEGPYLVFTAQYHLKRGTCCNSGCRHCPYRSSSGRRLDKRLGSGCQQDLPCHSFFRHLMGLPNLRKREALGDRDGKFAACDLLGKLFQPMRVRSRPHLVDLNVAACG